MENLQIYEIQRCRITAYLANVLLTKLQGTILPWKSRGSINPIHAS